MAQEKEYFAFISYQRKDEEWADRLRNKLEHYRLPSSVRKQDASLPKEIRPIFRDALELAGGVLAKEIETALQQSKYLIVICSPNSAKSPWVNKEIQTFIDLGREEYIIPFIIDGTPYSEDPETECFPPSLHSLRGENEILGINIDELGREAATVKVVARMFGLKFDMLWQRFEREQKKKRRTKILALAALTLFAFGMALYIWHENVLLQEKDWSIMQNRSRAIAEKASTLTDDGDSYLAQLLAISSLPVNLNHPDRPYCIESEILLRNSTMYNNMILHLSDNISNMVYLDQDKMLTIVKAKWSGKGNSQYSTTLRVIGNDDIGIVNNITSIISKEEKIAMRSINIDSNDGLFCGNIVVQLEDTSRLEALIKKMKGVKGVKSVDRL